MSPEATRSPAVFLISTKTVVPCSPPVPAIDTGKVFVGDGIDVMIGANGAVVSSVKNSGDELPVLPIASIVSFSN